MTEQQHFLQLIAQLDLNDLGLDKSSVEKKGVENGAADLRNALKKAIADKDNATHPSLVQWQYCLAELEQLFGDKALAQAMYSQTTALANAQTASRNNTILARLAQQRKTLRIKLLLWCSFWMAALSVLAYLIWQPFVHLQEKSSQPAERYAFAEWLQNQQAAEVIDSLQKNNPQLTFDFSPTNKLPQKPIDALQQIINSGALTQKQNNDNKGDGNGGFSCSVDTRPKQCSLPAFANGPARKEVEVLISSYLSTLPSEGGCEKIDDFMSNLSQQLQWNSSEQTWLADLERSATRCYYHEKNYDKMREHAQNLLCLNDIAAINTAYWYLTTGYAKQGQQNMARTMYACFNEAIEYNRNAGLSDAFVASRYREAGALAWIHLRDFPLAISKLEQAKQTIQAAIGSNASFRYVASEINLDLMETYVVDNVSKTEFEALNQEIISNNLLTDGYKQVRDSMVAMYYIQQKDTLMGQKYLNHMVQRFELMPEYICDWDWTGFDQAIIEREGFQPQLGQLQSISKAANCNVEMPNDERIQILKKVLGEL